MSEPTATASPYVLACIDGAAFSQAVCDYSIWLAKTVQLPVRFLHVIEHAQSSESDFSGAIGLGASEDLLRELTQVEENHSKLLRKQGQLMLKAAQEQAVASGIRDVQIEQRHGTLVDRLVELEAHIGFAVIGIRGETHEDKQNALGAQLEAFVRSIHRPVLVVNSEFQEPKTCMLAYDGSQASTRALEVVAKTAGFKEYVWILAHANTGQLDDNVLQIAQEQLQSSGFLKIKREARTDRPEDALVFCQNHNAVDLTVMGAYSHHPLRGFLFGSFTEKMLRRTKKPLLLIH